MHSQPTPKKKKRIIDSLASRERKEVKEGRNAMDENIPGLENLVGNRNHCANRVTLCPFIDSLQNHRPQLSQVHFRAVQPPKFTGEHETAPRHLSQTLHSTCNGKTQILFRRAFHRTLGRHQQNPVEVNTYLVRRRQATKNQSPSSITYSGSFLLFLRLMYAD